MKTSSVLKKAKEYLAKNSRELECNYKESFICICIDRTTDNKVSEKDAERVTAIVQSRLGSHYTLEKWLHINYGIKYVCREAFTSKRIAYLNKIQTTRHAWVDSMIAEFNAKGD